MPVVESLPQPEFCSERRIAQQYSAVQLIHRGLLHRLGRRGAQLSLLSEDLGIERIAPERSGDRHELPDHLRVSDGRLEGDAAAE